MENKEQVVKEEQITLGANLSSGRRIIAFAAIMVIYFFYCYNFMLATFVRKTLTTTFGFSLSQASSIFAVLSLGTIPGTFIAGMCAARFGKKRTLMGIAIIFAAMTLIPLINPASPDLWRIARFITGAALGGVYGTAIPLVTEMFEQKYRGKLVAICSSMFSLAIIFGGIVYSALGDANWTLLMYTAAVPPLVGVALTFFLVPDDAQNMAKLREESAKNNEKISYIEMYKGKYLFIGVGAILLSGMNFLMYSGYSNNATNYFTTSLGLTAIEAGIVFSAQGIGQLIGYNFWGLVSDKFGRKVPLIGMAASALIIFLISRLNGGDVGVLRILSFFIGICFGFSGAWGAYYTELFPIKFRTLAPGISFNGGRIVSSFGLPLVAGIAATPFGMKGVFLAVTVAGLVGTGIWFLLPETLKKKTEEK